MLVVIVYIVIASVAGYSLIKHIIRNRESKKRVKDEVEIGSRIKKEEING